MSPASTSPFPKGLNILIVGAGCAGPALALTLQKTNPRHTITVIERLDALRVGGQQLDLKAQGLAVCNNLGLLEKYKPLCVKETGLTIVDWKGNALTRSGVSAADEKKGPARGTLTNEYELMRGDIVRVLYDESLAEKKKLDERFGGKREGGLTYLFNTTITKMDQNGDGVVVELSNGRTTHYDLVVAADGQNSRTRKAAFGEKVNQECFNSVEVHAAYYNIPRIPSDTDDAHIYIGSGGRMVLTRTGNRDVTQVYFFLMKDKARHERMRQAHRKPIDEQKAFWADVYKDAGYQCERFVEGLKTAKDFYAHEIGQIRLKSHHAGRVVLLGDAGYCPSPFTGMGTTLSLVGSHLLAGELAKHGDDVDAALKAYDEQLSEPLKAYQRSVTPSEFSLYPSTNFTIWLLNTVLWLAAVTRIDKVVLAFARLLPGRSAIYELPLYPGLGLPLEKEG